MNDDACCYASSFTPRKRRMAVGRASSGALVNPDSGASFFCALMVLVRFES